MATLGQGASPVHSKRELGEVKRERPSSRIDHVGRPKIGLPKGPQTNLGVPIVFEDKSYSVPKAGGVLRSLAGGWYRGRRVWGRPRVLLSPFYGAKGQGQTSSNYRSFLLKQRDKEKRPKNARSQVNSQVDKTGNVGGETGFKRRLLPRSSPPFGLEILQVLPKKERNPSKELLLQKDALRPDHGPVGVLEDPGTIAKDPKAPRDFGVCLFGRFPDPGILQGGSLKKHRGCHKASAGSWVQDKLGQVLGGTSQDPRILGSSIEPSRSDLLSSRGEGSEDPSHFPRVSKGETYFKEILGSNGRVPYLRSELPQMGGNSF